MDDSHKQAMRDAPRPGPVTHTVRTADSGLRTFKRYARKLAMNTMCTECMGFGNPAECTSPLCPMYPYRRRTNKTQRGEA